MKPTVILIDDDPNLNRILSAHLEQGGFRVKAFVDPEEGIGELDSGDHRLVVTDMKMKPVDGLEVLRRSKKLDPDIPVIMITGHATVKNAVESMKEGAYDYIMKPFSREEFLHIVKNAVDHYRLKEENRRLRKDLSGRYDFSSIIGGSPAMSRVFELMEKALDNDVTVLITGESGTGKELVARAIHYNGPRAGRPFVVVNCAAVPASLIESELFGHVKGAFTGAHRDRTGKFEAADGGTIFLDEIGDLETGLQAKLLRVLQEGELERVGEGTPRPVDVRVIAATNRDIEAMVREGTFREDLYYRISVFPIDVPPLRERTGDIPLLVGHFTDRFGASAGRPVSVHPDALRSLSGYEWPGNVRELQNVIERAVLLAGDGEILPGHLLESIARSEPAAGSRFTLPEDGVRLEELERDLIRQALERAGGNKSKAARLLGISRPTLLYRLEKHGLEETAGPEAEDSE